LEYSLNEFVFYIQYKGYLEQSFPTKVPCYTVFLLMSSLCFITAMGVPVYEKPPPIKYRAQDILLILVNPQIDFATVRQAIPSYQP